MSGRFDEFKRRYLNANGARIATLVISIVAFIVVFVLLIVYFVRYGKNIGFFEKTDTTLAQKSETLNDAAKDYIKYHADLESKSENAAFCKTFKTIHPKICQPVQPVTYY